MGNNTERKENESPRKRIKRTKQLGGQRRTTTDVGRVRKSEGEDIQGLSSRGEGRSLRKRGIISNTNEPKSKATLDRQSSTGQLRLVKVGVGLPSIDSMMIELQDMTDVLMGRVPPPIDAGHITLMEIADAYFSRASEMTMLLQKGEREGIVGKGSTQYKFRTGELRTFLEMAKRASDLGSRRLTEESLLFEMQMHGRESKGHETRNY